MTPHRVHALCATFVLALAAVGLSACGSSNAPASTSTTTTSSTVATSSTTTSTSSTTSTTTSTTVAANGESVSSLLASAGLVSTKTFAATWTSVEGGDHQSITLAQSPPKTYFASSGGFFFYNGTDDYYCSTSGASTQCSEEAGVDPLAGVADLYNGTTFKDSAAAWETTALAAAAGYTVSYSSGTWGGQNSECVTASTVTSQAEWCVSTSSGVLTYWSGGGDSFTLTSYTSSPPASDFTLPAGAKVTPT